MKKIVDEIGDSGHRGLMALVRMTIFVILSFWVILPAGEWLWALTSKSSAWVSYQSVAVPTFRAGDNPLVTSTKFIKREFDGAWYVKVVSYSGETACYGHGQSHYTPDLDYPPKIAFETSFNEYVGDPGCSDRLEQGLYYLDVSVTWEEYGVKKSVYKQSSYFIVWGAK